MDNKLKRYLWGAFFVGALISGVAWSVHLFDNPYGFDLETQQWWRDFLLNAGAGIITSVLIIFFYDRILMQTEKKDRMLRRSIALDSLRRILDDHFRHVLFAMYRAAALNEKRFNSIDELFSEEYFREIEYLDFNKSPYLKKDDERQNKFESYSFVPRNYQIILEYNKRLTDYLLNEVLTVYGQFLETDICENIQKLRFSPFIFFSYQLPELTKTFGQWRMLSRLAGGGDVKANGFSVNAHEELIDSLKIHIEIFKRTVELYNKCVLDDQKLDLMKNTDKMSLEWGCCRVEEKIKPGEYSIKEVDAETDIHKVILKAIINIEKRLDKFESVIVQQRPD